MRVAQCIELGMDDEVCDEGKMIGGTKYLLGEKEDRGEMIRRHDGLLYERLYVMVTLSVSTL